MLAGGDSRTICMYDLQQKVLLRKFQTTTNRSLDGMTEHHPWWRMTEFGSMDLLEPELDDSDAEEDRNARLDLSLPGVSKGDRADRNVRPQARYRALPSFLSLLSSPLFPNACV